jgi:hypothetical protein
MKRKDIHLFATLVLAQGLWLAAAILFDQTSSDLMITLPLSGGIVVCVLIVAAKSASSRAWLIMGPVAAGLTFLPRLLTDVSLFLEMIFMGAPSIVLVIAAVLLKAGLTLHEERWDGIPGDRRTHTGRGAALLLALSGGLVAKVLYDLYWVMVWDNVWGTNYDWTGYLWVFFPFLTVMASSLALAVTLPERTKLAALGYLLIVSASIFTVAAAAQRVDQHRLTERRAERVVQAIEAYQAREGRYPQDLDDLTPRYALSLPKPVILHGQDWCYDAGADYYRLGYVSQEVEEDARAAGDRRQLSTLGRLYRVQGEVPNLPDICEQELLALE